MKATPVSDICCLEKSFDVFQANTFRQRKKTACHNHLGFFMWGKPSRLVVSRLLHPPKKDFLHTQEPLNLLKFISTIERAEGGLLGNLHLTSRRTPLMLARHASSEVSDSNNGQCQSVLRMYPYLCEFECMRELIRLMVVVFSW